MPPEYISKHYPGKVGRTAAAVDVRKFPNHGKVLAIDGALVIDSTTGNIIRIARSGGVASSHNIAAFRRFGKRWVAVDKFWASFFEPEFFFWVVPFFTQYLILLRFLMKRKI